MDIKTLLPIIIIQAIFAVGALVDLVLKKKTRNLNPWAWAAIIIFINILGPALYFTLGRDED